MQWSLVDLCARNVHLTYAALAKQVHAQRVNTLGFDGYFCQLPHTIGNFAINLKLNAVVTSELVSLANDHPSIQLYHLPSDEPANAVELLASAGFDRRYSLELFGTPPHHSVAPIGESDALDIVKAEEFSDRLLVMEFIAAEFLPRPPGAIKKWMVDSTANARELDLYSITRHGERIGAFMLAGFGECLGLYNLCISGKYRRKGIGAHAVCWILKLAESSRRSLVLQCDASLSGWYRGFDLKHLGVMHVFGWSGPNSSL